MSRLSARQASMRAMVLVALVALARTLPGLFSRSVALIAATLQIYWPLLACEKEGLRIYGQRAYAKGIGGEVAAALLVLCASVPPWAFLAHYWFGGAWPSAAAVSFDWAFVRAGSELVLLAAQEEWFWRGYVQPSFDHPTQGVITTSVLFALCHWAFLGTPLGLATFFPSLVFGALRMRKGRLLACTLVHIGYNAASRLLVGSA